MLRCEIHCNMPKACSVCVCVCVFVWVLCVCVIDGSVDVDGVRVDY